MATNQRPLSPHLQVYRPQITSVLSILHRMTGVTLAFGAFGVAYWLLAVSASDMRYNDLMGVVHTFPGALALVVWSWCLVYHLLNGIRHLFWDMGKGFEIKQFQASGWAVVILSFVLTSILFELAMRHGGAP